MARLRVATFLEEIADEPKWRLVGAELFLDGTGEAAWLRASVVLRQGRGCFLMLRYARPKRARAAWREALERHGYRASDRNAFRYFDGARDLRSEIPLVERLLLEPSAIATMPHRPKKEAGGSPSERFAIAAWKVANALPAPWRYRQAAARYVGRVSFLDARWSVETYGVLNDPSDEARARVAFSVHVSPIDGFVPSDEERKHVDRTLRAELAARGYRRVHMQRTDEPDDERLYDKNVFTLREARHERKMLAQMLARRR